MAAKAQPEHLRSGAHLHLGFSASTDPAVKGYGATHKGGNDQKRNKPQKGFRFDEPEELMTEGNGQQPNSRKAENSTDPYNSEQSFSGVVERACGRDYRSEREGGRRQTCESDRQAGFIT